ncbi:hypothetical protein [Fulvitalea axinellae]|uniref:hypothetical protein n=1 Tax=Fulvitalea axinellae TaxID=1182444 RepID=UPI0030CA54AB
MSSSEPVIQRAIGFELEVKNWRTWKCRDPQYLPEAGERKNISYRRPHGVQEKLLKGEGYSLTSDRPSAESVPEFITDPFPETDSGLAKLDSTFRKITELVTLMHAEARSHPDSLNPITSYKDKGTVLKPETFFDALPEPDFHPQATVGVHLSKMSDLMRISGNPSPSVQESRFTRIKDVNEPPAFKEKESMSTAFGRAERALEKFSKTFKPFDGWKPSIELKNLCAYMIHYLECPMINFLSYPKSYFPVMARTDFAQIFNLLPIDEMAFFREDDGTTFLRIFEIVEYDLPEGPKLDMRDQFFAKGIRQGQPTASCHAIDGLDRATWIRNIPLEKDFLTQDYYPGKREQARQLDTMGGWYGFDRLGDWRIPVPVFELRRIQFTRDAQELPAIARDVFTAIVELNREPTENPR